MTSLGQTALVLVAHGWHVFPLRPRSKVPTTEHGLLDATVEAGRVAAWWRSTPDANLGVDCGRSGLLVVDLDGEEAQAVWAELAASRAAAGHAHEPTLVGGTGKGRHVYFAAPAGARWARSTAGRIGPGIDTRGAGGYVVMPPSVHPSGAQYRWQHRCRPAPAPGWLAELLEPPAPAPAGERRPLPRGEWATQYGRAALEGLVDEMLGQPEGARNDRLTRLAFRVGRLAAGGELDAAVAEQALVDAAAVAGLPHPEAASTVRRGIEAGVEAGPAVRRERDRWRRPR